MRWPTWLGWTGRHCATDLAAAASVERVAARSLFIPHADVRTRHATVDDAVAAFALIAGTRHVLMLWTEL
ncbi:hypothetical protein AB0368_15185 [Actinoplanes sp. NPDC051475]|uniref:hypothetical protein n=1 Tax=Actinoplanes sp. NPDC051475 TaxID=3157225 RepID=UPI00344D8AB2